MALWDLLGRSLGVPVVDLWGGPCRPDMALYASGGWADVDGIGAELGKYVAAGFGAVKMRVGVIDGTVEASVARVAAAREALGPAIELMVDAHGTFSVAEAKRFAAGVEPLGVRWFEEPVSADDRRGMAEVRASTHVAIAAGESEFTRFDFRDLVDQHAVDVLQPDLAICGGPTEGRRIAALAESYQLELAPHCWGSALSFSAGVSLAFASPAATVIEYSLGANPLLHDLADERPESRVPRTQWSSGSTDRPRPRRHPTPRVHRRVHRPTKVSHACPTTTSSTSTWPVGDLDAAVAFYTDVLGLGLAPTPDLGFPAQFIAINDYQEIHLNEVPDVTPAAGPLLHPRGRLQRASSAGPRRPGRSTRARSVPPIAWRRG